MNLATIVLSAFLLFCRIGGCLMVMPGFSSPRIPIRMRLAAAIGITAALTPLLIDRIAPHLPTDDAGMVLAILRESLIGGTIGLLGRVFFAALETLCTAAAMATGFGNVFGARVDEGESLPELASFIMLIAVTLFFVTGQHADVVHALASSYDALRFNDSIDARGGLVQIVDTLGRAFPLALQITSPFLLYGLVANFAIGLLNRLTPAIPVYFISTPFVIAGALALLYAIGDSLVSLFIGGFSVWLTHG